MFETAIGCRNRVFSQEQEDLVMMVKENRGNSLWDSFQDYWKEYCLNTRYLSDFEAWDVLSQYAQEMFDRSDWNRVHEYTKKAFFEGKSISPRRLAEMYLSAILMMQIRYPN